MIDSLYQRWYFPRPALAKQILSVLTQGTGDPLALIGERRIGKTSHLRAELVEHAQAKGYVAVYIDIQQHRTNPLMAIAHALQEAIDDLRVPQSAIAKGLKTPLKKLAAAGVSLDLGDAPTRTKPTDQYLLIDWLMKELLRVSKRPALLIFDEIQELATAPDADNTVAALRSAITKSKEHVRVVFTGSSQIKLLEMFRRSRASLYDGASTMPFPTLGDDFLRFVADRSKERFARHATVEALTDAFTRLQYRPRALIDLVILHASANTKSLAKTLDEHVQAQLLDYDFAALWAQLAPLQQQICLRIAHDKDVSSTEAREVYAKAAKAKDVSPGNVSRALKAMIDRYVLTKTASRGNYRFDDPLLGEWIRKNINLK